MISSTDMHHYKPAITGCIESFVYAPGDPGGYAPLLRKGSTAQCAPHATTPIYVILPAVDMGIVGCVLERVARGGGADIIICMWESSCKL